MGFLDKLEMTEKYMKKNLLLAVLFLALIGVGLFLLFKLGGIDFLRGGNEEKVSIESFEECVAANNIVMEIYPRQCRDSGGNIFIEYIGNELEKTDLIVIDSPRPNAVIGSPLKITGRARGYWFFEASFPVKLIGREGELLSSGIATAEGEWMTEDFVPFSAELEFDSENTQTGDLILEKDNPSGLPEHDDFLTIPVNFR